MPPWLSEAAALVAAGAGDDAGPPDWSRDIHPLDRTKAASAFVDAVGRPFELMRSRYRSRVDGELHEVESRIVNLAGEHGIDILTVVEDRGPVPDVDDWDDLVATFVYESTPVVIEYYDELGVKTWVEGQVDEIYGRPAADMIGRPGLAWLDPRHHAAVTALWVNLMSEPDVIRTMRLEVLRPDGSRVWTAMTLINRLADARIGAVVCLTHDITEVLAAEAVAAERDEALRRSHEEFETLASGVPVAVFRADDDGRVTFANRHWCLLVGLDDPVIGTGDDAGTVDLCDVVAQEAHDELRDVLAELALDDHHTTATVELPSADGHRVFELVCQVVGERRSGSSRPIIGTMRDVTSANELRHRARHDPLTNLLNRHSVDARLDEIVRTGAGHVLVAFIDLDGFKAVNDTFGHDAGDEVLRAVAGRLRDAVRPSDDVGRYGGDEFVIICTNAFDGAEAAVTSRIERALASPVVVDGATWQPAASIGIARVADDEDAADALRRADGAMYATKRTRRSVV